MTDREQEDFERRLCALEACAVDAVADARKCITNILSGFDRRLDDLEKRVKESEGHDPLAFTQSEIDQFEKDWIPYNKQVPKEDVQGR